MNRSWLVIAGLASCTIANPAYEGEDAAGPTSTGDGPEASGTPPATTSDPPPETGVEASGGETSPDDTGASATSSEETGTSGGSEEPLPPTVGPYAPPMPVPGINAGLHEDDDPTLPADMLELYFASVRTGSEDIWVATRESDDDAWGEPSLVVELSTTARDNTPEISLDGLTMMLSSDRDGRGDADIYVSTRPDREAPWSMPMRVDSMSSPERDVCPFVTDDGLNAYSCRGNELVLDLVHFERDGRGGPWSGPMAIAELTTPDLECGAWVDRTRRTIAFMSNRPESMGQTDLFVATRETVEESFGPVKPIVGLNSGWWDDDPWLSQDGGVVYFASDRTGGGDIYVAYLE